MFSIFRNNKSKSLETQKDGSNKQICLKEDIGQVMEEILERKLESLSITHNEKAEKLLKRVNKQNSMLEDIIDSIEEAGQENKKSETALRLKEQQQEGLLSLILKYQEYLELLSKFVKERVENLDEAEKNKVLSQFDLVFSELENERSLNGIKMITETGGKVNTGLHQVIQAEETDVLLFGETVKRVLEPGCIYEGKVIQKAKIIAYVYRGKDVQD